jgi:hypothetical protein
MGLSRRRVAGACNGRRLLGVSHAGRIGSWPRQPETDARSLQSPVQSSIVFPRLLPSSKTTTTGPRVLRTWKADWIVVTWTGQGGDFDSPVIRSKRCPSLRLVARLDLLSTNLHRR